MCRFLGHLLNALLEVSYQTCILRYIKEIFAILLIVHFIHIIKRWNGAAMHDVAYSQSALNNGDYYRKAAFVKSLCQQQSRAVFPVYKRLFRMLMWVHH